MDMRAFSKGYLAYYERARKNYNIQYTRCRISMLHEDPLTHNILVTYHDVNNQRHNEIFDLAVLSVGMEIPATTRQLGKRLGIDMNEYGFCQSDQFNPLETSQPGIFAAGTFRGPKDIPESVVEASGAAAAVAGLLGQSRNTLTTPIEYPPERDVKGEEPRIGVFICHCGSNIAGFLSVPDVTEYTTRLPFVVHAENNLYTCSQDSIRHISEQIKEYNLNRVVVASCTPRTHEPLFQDSLRAAGLNPYLFEMANIRNHCSWVHSNDSEAATQKAKSLVHMAVARAALLQPQQTISMPIQHSALVIGGGVAGMTSAVSLAEQGFPVHLVERESQLGGNLRHVFTHYPNSYQSFSPNPQKLLQQLIARVSNNPAITVHLSSEVTQTKGFMGNFTSTIHQSDGSVVEINHGTTILATGGQEYRGQEYGYGTDPRIVTQQQFEEILTHDKEKVRELKSVVMIQCIGPGEKFCSRICCSVAIKNALVLKSIQHEIQIVILYQDIRTYGFTEKLYTEARRQGIIFVRYDREHYPQVINAGNPDIPLIIESRDVNIQSNLRLEPDFLVLSMPVVPQNDVRELASRFKVPVDSDGFLLEAHIKLRPVDFANNGIFMAGLAHYPKLLDETMVQAQAAAGRAARILSRDTLTAGGCVAVVDQSKCTGCLTCVRICPFNVPKIIPDLIGTGNIVGAAQIEPAICQGCGICVAECPAHAIQLMHFTDAQMLAKVSALMELDVFMPAQLVEQSS
jgi:heterodisulfide reductase subunit A